MSDGMSAAVHQSVSVLIGVVFVGGVSGVVGVVGVTAVVVGGQIHTTYCTCSTWIHTLVRDFTSRCSMRMIINKSIQFTVHI